MPSTKEPNGKENPCEIMVSALRNFTNIIAAYLKLRVAVMFDKQVDARICLQTDKISFT